MDWLYLINTFWPIVVFIGTLAVGGFTYWLKSSVPTKAAHDALSEKVDTHALSLAKQNQRIEQVEAHIESAPTRQDLQESISGLSERVSAMEEGQNGIIRQLTTMNNYLHTIIEKSIPGAASR